MQLTQEQRSEYANAVWDKFLDVGNARRLTMTPAEFGLVQLWMREIPLRVVLQAMEQQKAGATLQYYGPGVLAEYRRWKSSLTA